MDSHLDYAHDLSNLDQLIYWLSRHWMAVLKVAIMTTKYEMACSYFQTSTKKNSTITYCTALMGDSHSCYDERVRPTNCDHEANYVIGV